MTDINCLHLRALFIHLIIGFLILQSDYSYATFKVKGIVKDSQTKEVLIYAGLGLKNLPIGTCTNQNGEFQLIVNDSLINETIIISVMGYECKEYLIRNMTSDYFEILLEPKIIQLDEILVLPPISSDEVLKNVIKNHSRNYPWGFTYIETFFRDIVRNTAPDASNKNYRLTEVALNIEDFGLDSYRYPKFKVHEIRNSFNYVESSDQLNSPMILGIQNPVSWIYKTTNLISRHSLKALQKDKLYSKEIIGTTVFEDIPFYILEIREQQFKIFGIKMDVTGGYKTHIFYINSRNWAIQEAKLLITNMTDSSTFLLKAEIKMQEYKGKYYLKLLDFDGYIPDELCKLDKGHQYKHKASILVNQIVLDRKSIERIRLRNAMKTDLPLWNLEYKYNHEFWESYNILLDKPIDHSVIKDLEQQVPLDDQFLDGGMKNSQMKIN